MNKDILDEHNDDLEITPNCKCRKKTLKDKLSGIFLLLAIWIPMFFIIEFFIIEDDGVVIRSMFYGGAVVGYVLCILFNPIYKKD